MGSLFSLQLCIMCITFKNAECICSSTYRMKSFFFQMMSAYQKITSKTSFDMLYNEHDTKPQYYILHFVQKFIKKSLNDH